MLCLHQKDGVHFRPANGRLPSSPDTSCLAQMHRHTGSYTELPSQERSATPSNIKLRKHVKCPNPPSGQIRRLMGFIIWLRLERLALKVRREIPERNGTPIPW